jgi:hypothetical protein
METGFVGGFKNDAEVPEIWSRDLIVFFRGRDDEEEAADSNC